MEDIFRKKMKRSNEKTKLIKKKISKKLALKAKIRQANRLNYDNSKSE